MGVPGSANFLLAGAQGYQIERSLRFNPADSAYLNRTPASAGNRTTWTLSMWVKRSKITSGGGANFMSLFGWQSGGSGQSGIIGYSSSTDTLSLAQVATTYRTTNAVFRDVSAWAHLVFVWDSNNATDAQRCRIYVNGSEATYSTSLSIASGTQLDVNSTVAHGLGADIVNVSGAARDFFDGYLTEINFIDGQALTPSSFGETDTITGVWKPKRYSGTYGTNGFYLKFADNSGTTSTTLGKDSSGNGNNWTPNNLSAATGGPTSVDAASGGLPIYNTTDTYGTTKGTGTRTDSNSGSIVLAIAMDGTNNGTTFTDESATIKGSGTAKTITRNGNSKTSTVQSKFYGSSGYFDGTGDTLTVPAGTDFAYGTGDFSIEAWIYPESTADKVIFAQTISGTNYVQLGKSASGAIYFTGTSSGAGTPIVTTTTVSQNTWSHVAVTRQSNTVRIFINGILSASSTNSTDFSNTTYVPTIGAYTHASGYDWSGYINDFRVYKGVAKYTSSFNPPSNTQNTTVAAGNDSLIDTPTPYADGGNGRGNYCTWNPIYTIPSNTTTSFTNGNLDFSVTQAEGTGTASAVTTMPLPTTGKWYWEITPTTVATLASTRTQVGVMARATIYFAMANGGADNFSYAANGQKNNNNTFSAYGNSYTANDVIGVAVDLDNGAIYFAKNGTWQNSGDPTSGSSKTGAAFTTLTGSKEYFPAVGYWGTFVANFGQRAFAYTPPSGFLALNTQNLPEPTIKKPSSYFDTKLYTGNGSTQTISGLGFSPDFVWIKCRSAANTHALVDSIRGITKYLVSASTAAEVTDSGGITSLNSDGFSLTFPTSTAPTINANGTTYVAWCWDESATPGFDIVTYTGDGVSNRTVGHALGVAPAMIIIKDRDTNSNANTWFVWHQSLSSGNNIQLEKTDPAYAVSSTSGGGIGTSPSSSTFTLLNGSSSNVNTNENGDRFVAYLWSEVAGFSKFGSYTGNGSTDGPFVFCGFRPRWIVTKGSSAITDWVIHDTARETYNQAASSLYPNTSGTETSLEPFDILSNGFKIRTGTAGNVNNNGTTYIFAAFAESPFKFSLAR